MVEPEQQGDRGDKHQESEQTADTPAVVSGLTDGVQLAISDSHRGLTNAVTAVLQGASWQRCRVHFMRNALAKVSKGHAEMVAATIRTIFAQRMARKSVSSSTTSLTCSRLSSLRSRSCRSMPSQT